MADKWWKEAVVYEIYCKSFCDSDGDGIGGSLGSLIGGVTQTMASAAGEIIFDFLNDDRY